MSIGLFGCKNNKDSTGSTASYPFQFKGLIKKPEVTSYMYGTHTITGSDKTYALQSTTINLDQYINKNVTVKGTRIEGYPVDGGPEFIDVKAVDEK